MTGNTEGNNLTNLDALIHAARLNLHRIQTVFSDEFISEAEAELQALRQAARYEAGFRTDVEQRLAGAEQRIESTEAILRQALVDAQAGLARFAEHEAGRQATATPNPTVGDYLDNIPACPIGHHDPGDHERDTRPTYHSLGFPDRFCQCDCAYCRPTEGFEVEDD